MSDSDSPFVETGRLLVMLFVLTPMGGPLAEMSRHVGLIAGIGHQPVSFVSAVAVAPIAGVLVAYGERRYGSVFTASFLTLFGWLALSRLSGLSALRVHGDPWLLAGELLMYLSALCFAIVSVFYVDWSRIVREGI